MKTNNGFTLIEVLVAMAIMAISLVAILSNQIQAVQLHDSTKNLSIATQLSRLKMAELVLEFKGKDFPEISEEQKGEFKEPEYADFKWTASFKPDEEFKKIGGMFGKGSIESKSGKDDIKKMVAEQMSGFGLDPNQLSELLEKAVKRLTVTVEWSTGLDDGEITVWQHFIDEKAQLPGQTTASGQSTTAEKPEGSSAPGGGAAPSDSEE